MIYPRSTLLRYDAGTVADELFSHVLRVLEELQELIFDLFGCRYWRVVDCDLRLAGVTATTE